MLIVDIAVLMRARPFQTMPSRPSSEADSLSTLAASSHSASVIERNDELIHQRCQAIPLARQDQILLSGSVVCHARDERQSGA